MPLNIFYEEPDPAWYPHKIKFKPVTSVPYWDETCGVRFSSMDEFEEKLTLFLDLKNTGFFKPRDYILKNLTLEKCAEDFSNIILSINFSFIHS